MPHQNSESENPPLYSSTVIVRGSESKEKREQIIAEVAARGVVLEYCKKCGSALDVTACFPLSTIACPECNAQLKVLEHFGSFVLLSVLGRGGMGSVCRAFDRNLERDIALKMVRNEYINDPEYAAQLEKEAQSMAMILHPNVVRVYSAGIENGIYFIAMEIVKNGSVASLMQHNRLNEGICLDIAEQVAQGLQAASRAGLLHRDIKPGNILKGDDGLFKITDFGLAMTVQQASKTDGDVWGTPEYVSPEKILKAGEDVRSDIYSLGATLYHMLTGRRVFDGNSASDVALKHVEVRPLSVQTFAPEISNETSAVISQMLEKEPGKRQQTYEELLEQLRFVRTSLADGTTVRKQLQRTLEHQNQEEQKSTALMTAFVIGALLLIGVLVMFLTTKEKQHATDELPRVATVKPKQAQTPPVDVPPSQSASIQRVEQTQQSPATPQIPVNPTVAGDVPAVIYWDGGGKDTLWSTRENWNSLADGSGSDPIVSTSIAQTAVFNISSKNDDTTITLWDRTKVKGLIFGNSGPTTILAHDSETQFFLIDREGITVKPDAGAVTFGHPSKNARKLSLTLVADQSWINNGKGVLSFKSELSVNYINLQSHQLTLGGDGDIFFISQIKGSISEKGDLPKGITKVGAGTVTIVNNSLFHPLVLEGGIWDAVQLRNAGEASSIGSGTHPGQSDELVFGNGALRHSAPNAASTDRLFTIGNRNGLNAIIDSSAEGPDNTLRFTGTGSLAFGGEGPRSLTLKGSNPGENAFSPAISDGPGGATSLIKADTGTWRLTGQNTYTGPTSVLGGSLVVSGRLGATHVTVNQGARLGGTGQMGGSVTIQTGGQQAFVIAPSPKDQSTLKIGGTLTLAKGSILEITAAAPPAQGTYVILTATGGIKGIVGDVKLDGCSGKVSKVGNNLVFTSSPKSP